MLSSRFPIAFAAGFLAVLIFHQGAFALLHLIGFTAIAPYQMKPTQPFGIPQVISSAFWGGIWGMVFALIMPYLRRLYWLGALLFGSLGPTLVFLFIILPLRGQPVAGGWQPQLIATGLIVNGAWGLGTALLVRSLSKLRRQ
jgi:hypothetical protein